MAASKRNMYKPTVSAEGDLAIYDTKGKLLTKVDSEEVIHGMEHLDEESLYDELEMGYQDILESIGMWN